MVPIGTREGYGWMEKCTTDNIMTKLCIDSVKQGKIHRTLDALEGLTCLQFAPHGNERNYVHYL